MSGFVLGMLICFLTGLLIGLCVSDCQPDWLYEVSRWWAQYKKRNQLRTVRPGYQLFDKAGGGWLESAEQFARIVTPELAGFNEGANLYIALDKATGEPVGAYNWPTSKGWLYYKGD